MAERSLNKQLLDLGYSLALGVRWAQRLVTQPVEIGVRALVMRGDEVLLIRHRTGTRPWNLPGGGVHRREPLAVAAGREVREESGCRVEVERLHGMFYNFDSNFSNHIAVFVCRTADEPDLPPGDLEISAARFMTVGALPPDVDPGVARRLAEYLRGEAGLYRAW